MTPSKFIRKTAVKLIIFAFVMLVVSALLNSFQPIISNQIAMGQMENDDYAYILMNTYNQIKHIGSLAMTGVSALFIGKVAVDSYKFYKNYNNKKEKNENEEV